MSNDTSESAPEIEGCLYPTSGSLLIGREAAREVIGNIQNVDVATGINEEGHPSYYFELHVNQSKDRAQASLLRTRLRQKIRDLLIADEDEKYPYVRIIDDPR